MDAKLLLRQRLRAAADILRHLHGAPLAAQVGHLPQGTWDSAYRSLARLKLAVQREWQMGAERAAIDAQYALRQLAREVETLQHTLPATRSPQAIAPLRDILADFAALGQEFERTELQLREHTLSVWTSSVVLEGVELGRFAICLDWRQIGREPAYRVIAEDPCYPDDNSDVTHPHVHNDVLCEGEGSAAIRAALRTGRLLDFFTLVRQVLLTYNSSSAYVSLGSWSGQACPDCGLRVPSDDMSRCDRCGDLVCDECRSCCSNCDADLCNSCALSCSSCEETYCVGCLRATAGSQLRCASCQESGAKPDDTVEHADAPQAAVACLNSEQE